MKVIIVGGVAGGASCATRLRRLDEHAEIIIFDKGHFVSFANCGLPYHIGNVIEEESSLLLANPELFWNRFRIKVQIRHEVIEVNTSEKWIKVKRLEDGSIIQESYDRLVLSPGGTPIRPPLPGIDSEGVFVVRSIPDARDIKRWIEEKSARRVVVAGGGFIGLEMAENLRHLGLEVVLIQNVDQVMPPMDREMIEPLHDVILNQGIDLKLNTPLEAVRKSSKGLIVQAGGKEIECDAMVLGLGVRPDVSFLKNSGLEIGSRGGIRVDEQMRTSDEFVYAVGDAIEVVQNQVNQSMILPLAGPANRQGRLVADAICGRPIRFRGVQGTAICGLFGWSVASTGLTEKAALAAGMKHFKKIYLHPKHHVGYYPGAKTLHMKMLYEDVSGRLLGLQVMGQEDVARKVDVFSAYLQMGATVHDLAEAELCYAPQFGGAKDALNYAGFIAANELCGDLQITSWEQLPKNAWVLDVRDRDEFEESHYEQAHWIELNALRDHLNELPKDKTIYVYCGVGQRAYYAARILTQCGYDAVDISGGLLTANMLKIPLE